MLASTDILKTIAVSGMKTRTESNKSRANTGYSQTCGLWIEKAHITIKADVSYSSILLFTNYLLKVNYELDSGLGAFTSLRAEGGAKETSFWLFVSWGFHSHTSLILRFQLLNVVHYGWKQDAHNHSFWSFYLVPNVKFCYLKVTL